MFFPCVGQPASNLLYAHLLWASSNHTGAVWHYRRALEVQPELRDAFNTLRALRCYLKYHQAAQSAAPVETPTTPLTHNCIQKPASGNGATGGQTESRVICKTVGSAVLCFSFSLSFLFGFVLSPSLSCMIIISWCRLCALFFSNRSVAVVFKTKQKQTEKGRRAGKKMRTNFRENVKIQSSVPICILQRMKGQLSYVRMWNFFCIDPSSSRADLTDRLGITCVV